LKKLYLFEKLSWLIISCLGIFGLAKFNVEQRTKEIGIRKVNGASVKEIVYLLNWDVSKIVLLALVIVTPIAYFIIKLWLQNFAYKIPIGIWTFFLTGIIVFASALLSIINVTLKASLKNPVDSLKYE
jgi:putative ABC transport system permease protein